MTAIEVETIRGDGVTLGELSRNILDMKAEFKGVVETLKEIPSRREIEKIESDLKAEHAKDVEILRAEHKLATDGLNADMIVLKADVTWAHRTTILALLGALSSIVLKFIPLP